MHIAILGAGITGLTIAYELKDTGHRITFFEKHDRPGGLARSFNIDGEEVEVFYHFICMNDTHLLDLVKGLGLEDRLRWIHTSMDYYYQGKMYPFSETMDVFRFTPMPLFDRLRFGLSILYIQSLKNYEKLDRQSAKDWIIKFSGREAYEKVWRSLLEKKFDTYASQLSAAWLWGRTQRRARSRKGYFGKEYLGYIEGGTNALIKEMEEVLRKNGITFHYNAPAVKTVCRADGKVEVQLPSGEAQQFDRVISTMPAPLFLNIVEGLPEQFIDSWRQFKYLDVLCILLQTKAAIQQKFWTNICAEGIPYLGVIEYTNLNDLKGKAAHLTYLPQYLPPTHPDFKRSKESLFEEAVSCMRKMYRTFHRNQVINYWIFQDPYAQPICSVGHARRIMPFKTPHKGLMITDATQIFPEDRGVNNAIRLGKDVAQLMKT